MTEPTQTDTDTWGSRAWMAVVAILLACVWYEEVFQPRDQLAKAILTCLDGRPPSRELIDECAHRSSAAAASLRVDHPIRTPEMLFIVVKTPTYGPTQIGLQEADSKESLMKQLGARPVPADLMGAYVPDIQVVGVGEFATLPNKGGR